MSDQTGEIVIEREFVETVQKTAQVLLRASAELNSLSRNIDRNYGGADDKIIRTAIFDIQQTSGDLADMWREIDLTLGSYGLISDGGVA